ncbi:MAG: hypothetical protein PHQ88_00180 [Bacteroides sp.]|nr:hypothetical protein [Bacteroides sp.]MDD4054826.1 hypothetical protein [Bacteroides sp.]MDD4719264.1 hypothetical protein [Bacteroides sp.]NLI64600.1 hypothetical protein [Bacteroidales bacterium]
MGFFSRLFNRNSKKVDSVDNVEDFMMLIRVYFQAVIAQNNGITNIRVLPDLANFKRLFKVPTERGKLGVGEKSVAKKMLKDDYDISDDFFKEIDSSIRKNCRSQNEVQPYLFMFQGFTNDLMMLIGNLMQWKMRIPSRFRKTLYNVTQETIHEICTKPVFKKDDVHKTAMGVQQYKERLGYSENWITEFVFNMIILAKKEAKQRKKEKKNK